MAVQMEYEKDVKVPALDGKKNRRNRLWFIRSCTRTKLVTQVTMSSSVCVLVNHSIKQKKMDLKLTQLQEATKLADIIMILAPDEIQKISTKMKSPKS